MGKAWSGPMAISRNSFGTPVGRQISSEAELSPGPPSALHEVTLHDPPPAGTGGTTYEGEALSVVSCMYAQGLPHPPKNNPESGAAAPIVAVSAAAVGTSHSAPARPSAQAKARLRISHSPSPPNGFRARSYSFSPVSDP